MTSIPAEVIFTPTPVNELFSAKYKKSLAFTTVHSHLTNTLDQILDYLKNNKDDMGRRYGAGGKREIPIIINRIRLLKKEIQENKPFVPFSSTGTDIAKWNKFIEEETNVEVGIPKWYTTVWLYAECYMYRRLHEILKTTQSLAEFDPFERYKQSSVINSIQSMEELSMFLVKEVGKSPAGNEDAVKKKMVHLMHISAWGAKCDSDIAGSPTNPLEVVDQLRANLIMDESLKVWPVLNKPTKRPCIVDFVLETAGYELFTDLCLADFLCSSLLVEKIRFHLKSIPWYVTDATLKDFTWLLATLKNKRSNSLLSLSEKWQRYLNEEKWTYACDEYWTLPFIFSEMPRRDPDLYKILSSSTLIVFKGNVNYRKLVGELNWDPTTKIKIALGDFHPTNIIALRTIKADVICGLKPGQADELSAKNRDWMLAGNYAMIQYGEAKK